VVFNRLLASGSTLRSRETGASIISRLACDHKEHEEKDMKSNSLVRETSKIVLSPYVILVAIQDDIAVEATARAMGWEPVERKDGTTIWVRSKDIGLDKVQYCDTALEVVRTYTH
jgi:hypothetical protein